MITSETEAGRWVSRDGGGCLMGTAFQFWEDEEVLERDGGDGWM